jgi:hypothetical protein
VSDDQNQRTGEVASLLPSVHDASGGQPAAVPEAAPQSPAPAREFSAEARGDDAVPIQERAEVQAAGAFVGGLLLAVLLKRVADR